MVAVPVDVPAADASVNALLMASLTAGAAPSASASSLLDAAVGAALAPGGALVEGLAGDPADDDGEEGRGEVAVAAHFAGQSFLPGSSFMPPMPPGQGGVGGGGADEKGEKSLPPQQLGSPSKRSPSPVVGAGKISCPVCQLSLPPHTHPPLRLVPTCQLPTIVTCTSATHCQFAAHISHKNTRIPYYSPPLPERQVLQLLTYSCTNNAHVGLRVCDPLVPGHKANPPRSSLTTNCTGMGRCLMVRREQQHGSAARRHCLPPFSPHTRRFRGAPQPPSFLPLLVYSILASSIDPLDPLATYS